MYVVSASDDAPAAYGDKTSDIPITETSPQSKSMVASDMNGALK